MDGSETTEDVGTVAAVELNGTWRLADCRKYYADGHSRRPWGNSVSGYLVYAPDGHVCEVINFTDSAGRIRSSSYCGSYRIDNGFIHHTIFIGADINAAGTTQTAGMSLDADRLTLTVTPAPGGGPGSRIEYHWARAHGARDSDTSTHRALAGNRFNREP
jgi:hypothetical protein